MLVADPVQIFGNKSIVSMKDLSKDEILYLLDVAEQVKRVQQKPALQGKILASCFFEPSTRTKLSFEAAMKRAGGSSIGFSDQSTTSVSKKETLHDTVKIVGQYADVIVLRHPLEGAARFASEVSNKPVINAGDGANQHPTQTLIDLFSIRESQGKIDQLHIGFAGDLRHARTIRSLVQACALFNMRFYFIPTQGLDLSNQMYQELKKRRMLFSIHDSLETVLPKLDILYMTRIQEERFVGGNKHDPQQAYTLSFDALTNVKPNFRVLHPLPRVKEIDPLIDDTSHAYYFHQSQNGIFVREALLRLILGVYDDAAA